MALSPTVLLTRETILVVDDVEPIRRYLARVLEYTGYHVLTARDGSDALRQLRESPLPVQLVITDVSMSGMTGPELADRIAAGPYRPPVLFISGDHTILNLPGPVLRKPFLLADLRPIVERLLRSARVPLVAAFQQASEPAASLLPYAS
jgi:CheY-like chemotaxis protein